MRLVNVSTRLIFGMALISLALPAQQPGGGGGGRPSPGGGGGTPTTGTTRDSTQGTPRQPDRTQQQFPQFEQRPLFLSGKVVLDSGSPPPESVSIERVCGSRVLVEGYTDSKGRFSFELGRNNAIYQDASTSVGGDIPMSGGSSLAGLAGPNSGGSSGRSLGFGDRELMGCELRASLPGYRSDLINLTGRKAFDNPDVGAIVLHRLANVEGTTISAIAIQAPKDAQKALQKGREAVKKNKVEEARKEFEKAIALYPNYTYALYSLGLMEERQNRAEEAKKLYNQAINADPKYISPYLQLAGIAAREQKWPEVVDYSDRALKLNPVQFPGAYLLNAVGNYQLQKFEAAELSAREGQKIDQAHQFPKIDHVLGVILAGKQDYSGAVQQMRNYLKFAAPTAPDIDVVKGQVAELEKLSGPPKASAAKP